MNTLARALTGLVIGFALVGCVSIPSEFDFAQDAGASAQVVMPYPLRVTDVNGREVSLPPVIEFPYTVTLDAGPSVVGFQYGEPWGTGDENQLVRGPIVEVAFAAQPGALYAVEFDAPADVRDRAKADDYFAGFTAWLRDPGGQRTAAVPTGSSGGVKLNLTESLAGSQPADDIATAAAATEVAPDDAARLESMKQIWQQATAEERQAFMQWVVAPGN